MLVYQVLFTLYSTNNLNIRDSYSRLNNSSHNSKFRRITTTNSKRIALRKLALKLNFKLDFPAAISQFERGFPGKAFLLASVCLTFCLYRSLEKNVS